MTAQFFKLNQRGYTLIEMAIATLLMGIMATTVILANRFVNVQTVQNSDRTFATEKAIQMYEELRALVNGNEKGIAILDNYNQFVLDNVLTTDKSVDVTIGGNPGDPLSGNIKTDGNWRYSRIITVAPVANDTQGRRVTVKVFLYPGDTASQTMTGTLLATVGGILRTSILPFEPTQVLDVYILQINNIPSWWSVLPTLAADMDNAIADLQSRLTGLQIRAHYITRTSYGRDSLYQPEINSSSNPAESTHQSWVYFYPGYTEQDSGGDSWYFDGNTGDQKNSVFLTGNFMEDGTPNSVSNTQFGGANITYSVADQYNNAMRYPDELAAFQAVTAAAAASGQVNLGPVTEISERMLLEGMLSQPASFQNAIIVNLHGELLPLPPLRNYSDAAKDPGNQLSLDTAPMTCAIPPSNGVSGNTNVRVVTHPELLYYPVSIASATAVTVRLRVYAYYDTEDVGGSAGLPNGDYRVPYISLFLPDACATVVGVTVNIGSTSVAYNKVGITTGLPNTPGSTWTSGNVPGDTGGPMNMSVSYVGPGNKQTLITLANTPLRSPVYTGGGQHGGLNASDMLYGAEYIPCSPDQTSGTSNTNYYNNTYNFGNDLGNDAVTASNNPKNTARWIISIAMPVTQNYPGPVTFGIWSGGLTTTSGAVFTQAGTHAIETRLGKGVTSSMVTIGASPTTISPNLSRTYVWCGATIPPYTEQYQFMGDPRDCPYYDVKVGGISVTGAGITIGPNAYNWWFKGTVSEATSMTADGYVSFGQGAVSQWDGNGGGNIQVDLPRYYQLIRQGLLATTSIWTGTNGWSWFYYGVGGEYGSDQGPRTNGVIMYDDLFKNTSGGSAVADFNAIYPGDGKDGSHGYGLFVASNTTGTTGANPVTWYQRSWLGELYPDKSYLQEWLPNGNLPSVAHSGTPPETFYLEPMHKVNYVTANSSLDGFAGVTFWVCPAGYGSESFYDGKNTSTNGRFEHNSNDANGTELNLAVTTYNIFPFPLPSVIDVNREWDLGGGNTPESGIAPYNSAGMTTTIDIPTVTSTSLGTVSRLFYSYGSATTYASGVMRMTQKNAGVTQVGYVVESGYAPSTGVGPDILAETALVFGMRTFLDGGLMAVTNAAGHIPQLPLVRLYFAAPVPVYNASETITFTVGCPVTATTAGGGAVAVGMPVTDIWWGFNPNGLANFYTEEYPFNNGSVTSAAMTGTGFYQESGVTVVYNLKYSNGSGWYNVSDNSSAVTGVYDSTHSYNPPTYTAPWTYNWLVNNGTTTLPQASYELMVEAYRLGYGLHYSYDIQKFQVSW